LRFGKRRTFLEPLSKIHRTALEAGTEQARTKHEPSTVISGLSRTLAEFDGLPFGFIKECWK
ncbi:hypothetical protein, partial [Pseudopedobacter sp.]|uniref:hypothetical protein n=1 Tax=Pseudopedobacter sp. TaxID=1936787 RepID=UPI00333E3B60